MRRLLLLLVLAGACLALGTAHAGNLADARVTRLSFESIPAQEAFARIGAQAGLSIAFQEDVHALVTARSVSGRLPVVLDRLTASLGLTWEENNGVVVVHRKVAGAKPGAMVGSEPVTTLPTSLAPAAPIGPAVASSANSVVATPAAATPKPEEPIKALLHAAFTLKLTSSDLAAYALRDFLRGHGLALVWGAGDVGSVATVSGEYTGDTPLAVADAVLRAHALHGIYARSDKTLYVR